MPPDGEETMPDETIEVRAQAASESAKELVVTDSRGVIVIKDQATLDLAGEKLIGLNALIEEAELALGPQKQAAWDSYQVSLQQYKRAMDPLTAAKKMLAGAIALFYRQAEARRLAQEELLRRQAEERARLEREAEVRRLREEEQRARAEAEVQREADIEAAEAEGNLLKVSELIQSPIEIPNRGLADAIAAEPIQVTAPTVAPTYRKPTGISLREPTYTAAIEDAVLLCASIGRKETPVVYVNIEPSAAMKALARAGKRTWHAPPGVKVVETESSGVVGRRK